MNTAAIHPSIPPELADAMLKVRALFVEKPSAFDPSGVTREAPTTGACITCQTATVLGYRTSARLRDDYPDQSGVLLEMFAYTAENDHLEADWAIERIDTFLATAK